MGIGAEETNDWDAYYQDPSFVSTFVSGSTGVRSRIGAWMSYGIGLLDGAGSLVVSCDTLASKDRGA